MMASSGILGFGAYIPTTRLQRSAIHAVNRWYANSLGGLAKGEKAISGWDEDAVTMAVEASRDCLEGRDRAAIGDVYFASTTAPFADRQNAGIVKEALNLADMVGSLDAGGSQRAGTSALITALRASAKGGTILHCAAERVAPPAASEREMLAGDAAAALLIGTGPIIAELIGSHSVTADFVDHFRAAGETNNYDWEARWVREEGYGRLMADAIVAALNAFGTAGEGIDHFIAPIAVRGVPELLARKARIRPEAIADTLGATVGHAGAAHPTLLLASVLEKATPGQTILLTGFGQGCDVLLFRVTDRIGEVRPRLGVSGWLARRRADDNYMRYLSFRRLVDLDRGMRAEHDQKQSLPALWRSRKGVMALVGGRCTKTGTVQFPRSDVSVNPNDHAIRTQEDYPLAELPARIMTYTADSLTFTPDPPNFYGNIEFDGGGRLMAEFTDIDPEAIEVGAQMRMMFRIKAFDEMRHFRRYFWKAAPAF